MIRYVKLKNYKSLVNLDVDFMDTQTKPKKIIAIYGENGVGKSNFANCFYTLGESIRTMSCADIFEKMLNDQNVDINNENFRNYVETILKTTPRIIEEYKTVNSKENMSIEIGFTIKSKNGMYKIEYDNEEIVSEILEYTLNDNIKEYYNITKNNIVINKSIFLDNTYYKEFSDLIEKYWGKHSFLSILLHETIDKKMNYVKEKVNNNLFEVLRYLQTIGTKVMDEFISEYGMVGTKHKMLRKLKQGNIPKKDEKLLDSAEKYISYFFTKLYADIKNAYYEKEEKENRIYYKLMFKKNLYGEIKNISYDKESSGTLKLIELLPYFISACEGRTVVVDEIDNGIHDLLISKIINDCLKSIKGQLIITTHNTLLFESDIPNKNIYVFNVNRNAEKELIPITEFEGRIHPNNNPRKKYLSGMYGGIPYMSDVDFDELMDKI